MLFFFFFFNDTATTEIYTLSLHDALPIWGRVSAVPEALAHPLSLGSGGTPAARRDRRLRGRAAAASPEPMVLPLRPGTVAVGVLRWAMARRSPAGRRSPAPRGAYPPPKTRARHHQGTTVAPGSAFENDHRRLQPGLMREAEVNVSDPLAAGLGRRRSGPPHGGAAAVYPDPLHLVKRGAARRGPAHRL